MDIHTLALLLLIPHSIAVVFMFSVILKQLPLLATIQDIEVRPLRVVLFVFAILLLIGNIIPIAIDLLTLADTVIRSSRAINPIGVLYSANNAVSMLLASVCFWLVYLLAERIVLNPPKN